MSNRAVTHNEATQMAMITLCLYCVSLKALSELLSYQPWEALDPKAVLHVRGAISCPQFTIVIPMDWCAIDACKTMTICVGLLIWIANTALIHPLVTPSLCSTLLNSFWVLDYTGIVDVVNATQTGSFMDGFATLINCKIDRGNPWQTTTVSHYPWCICTSSPWSAIFLLKHGWLLWKDYVLWPRACELAQIHDEFTALHIS